MTRAHDQDNLNVPIAPDFLIPPEPLLRAEMNKPDAAAAPGAPATPARSKVPMMSYDPSRFQGEARPWFAGSVQKRHGAGASGLRRTRPTV